MNLYNGRISNIHIKDRQINGPSCELGSGDANFELIFRLLRNMNEKLIILNPKESFKEQLAMCQNFHHNTAEKIHLNGKEAIYAIATGDEQKILLL